MRLISRRSMLGGTAAIAVAATLAACSKGSSGSDGAGGVYFLNFKPESEQAFKDIAAAYTKKTGVNVKVVTAASGTYEQTLKSEVAKSNPPTLFNLNGPVGYGNWKDYASDLSDADFTKQLTDESVALKGDEGKGFAKLKEVVEDMQAKKADLGIEGVFAATSLSPGEDWRWQTHLANYPVYYEYRDAKVDDLDEVKLTYSDNYKKIFDLYLNNSTIKPTEASAKTVTDSMADFALGKAAMVQNGNWGWSQISEVSGNTVKAEDVHFMPIYIGVSGEDKSNIAIGTENYLTINSQAAEGDQKATKDFLTWLFTDAEGSKMAAEKLSIIAPYKAYAELAPSDPLGKEVSAAINNKDLTPVKWVFPTFPSQDFKDQLGQHLAQYASGSEDWAKVKDFFVTTWASEKKASKEG